MTHPTVDGEATAATLDQFRTLWQPRGWELVPDGTPEPGEPGYQPHKAVAVPAADQPDTDESTDAAEDKPPAKSRRKPAADEPPTPDAATNPED